MGVTVVAPGVRTGVRECERTTQVWYDGRHVPPSRRAMRRTCEHTLRLGNGARQPPLHTLVGTTPGAHVQAAQSGAAATAGGACVVAERSQSSTRTCELLVAQWVPRAWLAGSS